MPTHPDEITVLLGRWSSGDPDAFPRLVALAYDDLRAIAHRRLHAGAEAEFSTTALVHEVYLRLVSRDPAGDNWENRAHFYAFASKAMRTILVDQARRTQSLRRGGNVERVPLRPEIAADAVADVLGVDEAITRLAAHDPRMAQVVELRFFGGFSVPEVAEVLGTSARTVERTWTRARAFLRESLDTSDDGA